VGDGQVAVVNKGGDRKAKVVIWTFLAVVLLWSLFGRH
jgi:hypothetical protein